MRDDAREALESYRQLENVQERPKDDASRLEVQPKLVSNFYDLVTKFYEFAWGTKFHFSPRRPGESFRDSQLRHEHGLCKILDLQPGMKVGDIGCGVGGPLVTIAEVTGANITGVNFNALQIRRAERNLARAGLAKSCDLLQADYMNVPLNDGTFDAIYAIESAPHAPNRLMFYEEMFRLLKTGGQIATIEWCFLDDFDSKDEHHAEIRSRIQRGNAAPHLPTTVECVEDVQGAGFEIIQAVDQTVADGDPTTPWYLALQSRDFGLSSWARTPVGRAFVTGFLRAAQAVKLVPYGTADTAEFLHDTADALVESGILQIFTPNYLIHARKPAK